MLVIRWYVLGPELLVAYPGYPVPAEARLLGVTVADEAVLKVLGDLLIRWPVAHVFA